MKLKELPVGNQVVFGSYAMDGSHTSKELIWTKVTEDGKCVLKPDQLSGKFDYPERGDVNRDRKAHGYNYFPMANVFQFINSPETQWFHPMHEGDRAGYDANRWGFLASFTSDEIRQLLPHEIEIGVPEGSRKQHGRKNKLKCLVSLPSASQYQETVDDYLQCEGEVIPLLQRDGVFRGWTRSGVLDSCHAYVAKYGWLDAYHCDNSFTICPMVVINPESELTLDPETGRYYVNIQSQEEARIMTDDFLNMILK